MNTSQLLTTLAMACLLTAAFRALRHLRHRRGLRLVFTGLFVAGVAAVAITFSTLIVAWLLSVLMLAGIAVVVVGIRVEGEAKGNA